MLLPETSLEAAVKVVDELRDYLSRLPFHFRQEQVSITLSAGVAAFTEVADADALFEQADRALYAAKQAGTQSRGRVPRTTPRSRKPEPGACRHQCGPNAVSANQRIEFVDHLRPIRVSGDALAQEAGLGRRDQNGASGRRHGLIQGTVSAIKFSIARLSLSRPSCANSADMVCSDVSITGFPPGVPDADFR